MRFESRVISGKGRGKGLGFPTLNLEIPADFNIQEGIYASRVSLGEKTYRGALHFGPIPVFNDVKKSLEIFVLDWDGGVSHHSSEKMVADPIFVSFEIVKFLRPIRNFDSPKALADQIAQDVAEVRKTA